MNTLDFNTTKKQKLSIYLSMHLQNKRYEMLNGKKHLSFTHEEARDALMKALRMAHNKKDAKEFLACIREHQMTKSYSATDASEKIMQELLKTT